MKIQEIIELSQTIFQNNKETGFWDEEGANGYTNRIMTGARQYLSYIRKKLKLKRLYSHLPKSNFLNQDKQLF